jgi:hypothetical protein
MPIIRYFLFTGALLLALLSIADRYLPAAPVDHADTTDIDKTIMRIHSARKLPEKIVFDTSNPPVASAGLPATERSENQPREALAMVPAAGPRQVPQAVPAKKRVAQRAVRSHRVARVMPPPRLAFDHHEFFGGW